MRLQAITDAILVEAIQAQESEVFDSHKIIFWIMQNRPREYVEDLHLALRDDGDPFVNLHTAIGRQLDRLPQIQGRGKTCSLDVRGQTDRCEVWERLAARPSGRGLPEELQRLRDALITAARERRFVSYTEAARILGLEGTKPWRSPRLFAALDEISTLEHREGRPLLSAVVVSSVGKRPGGGFFKMAKSNGVQGPDEDDKTFSAAELNRAWDYWCRHRQ